MILVSTSGMMCACRLVKESPKAWTINYNDKAFPNNVRVPKNSLTRTLVADVDAAFKWLGLEDDVVIEEVMID